MPGDRLTVEDQYGQDVKVRVSGIYTPDDPDDPAWTVARELLSPAVGTSDGVERTSVAALVSPEALPDLRIAVPSDELTQQHHVPARPGAGALGAGAGPAAATWSSSRPRPA